MKRVVSGVATVYIVEREPVAIDSGHTVANTTVSHLRSYTLHQSPYTNHHHRPTTTTAPPPPPPPPPHVLYSCTKDRCLSQL